MARWDSFYEHASGVALCVSLCGSAVCLDIEILFGSVPRWKFRYLEGL